MIKKSFYVVKSHFYPSKNFYLLYTNQTLQITTDQNRSCFHGDIVSSGRLKDWQTSHSSIHIPTRIPLDSGLSSDWTTLKHKYYFLSNKYRGKTKRLCQTFVELPSFIM